jgi:hypothetical protein
MREDATRTVDIGQYTFLAASPEGSELLLEKLNGGVYEIFRYNTAEASFTHLLTGHSQFSSNTEGFVVSEDLNAIYFQSGEQLTPEAPLNVGELLYREEVQTGKLSFIAPIAPEAEKGGGSYVSPDGEYYYFASEGVTGVPGGGPYADQVYRYDNAESVIQCMSCASSFNPEPKLGAYFLFGGHLENEGQLNMTIASDNGDYVFFDTTAALVPQDIDGEIEPEESAAGKGGHIEFDRSPSSDTYEWRKNGVDGCSRIEGCLSLITGGTGGYRNELLGTTPSGDDVFFGTHEALVGGDTDKAGDIYDARIDGGFPPPPPRPTECAGDSCSTPFAAPVDLTPSSATFQGVGDVSAEAKSSLVGKSKPKSAKKPKKKKKSKKAKSKKGTGKKASKGNRRRGK